MGLYDKLVLDGTKFKSLKYGNGYTLAGTNPNPLITKPVTNTVSGNIPSFAQSAEVHKLRTKTFIEKTVQGQNFQITQDRLQKTNSRLESPDSTNSRFPQFYSVSQLIAQAGDPNVWFHSERFPDNGYNRYEKIAYDNNFNNNNNRLEKIYNRLQTGWEKQEDFTLSNYQTIFPNSFSSNDLFDFTGATYLKGTIGDIRYITNQFTNNSNARRILKGLDPRKGLNKLNNTINKIDNTLAEGINIANRIFSTIRISDGNVIDEYGGGPNSGGLYGNGKTIIKRYAYTNDLSKTKILLDIGNDKVRNTKVDPVGYLFQNEYIESKQSDKAKFDNELTKLQTETKRTELTDSTKNLPNDPNYSSKTSESVLQSGPEGIIDKDSPVKYKVNISRSRNIKNGKVNAFDRLYKKDSTKINDNISFSLLDPFKNRNLDEFKFPSYVNSFKENFNPEWNPISYLGRSENFYVYKGFSRSLSFSFNILCNNTKELTDYHRDLGKLLSSTMGDYNKNTLGGIIVKLKLGNYINNEHGIITDLSYDVPTNSPWDIDYELAQYITVSVGFNVIHTNLPKYNTNIFNFV